MQEIEQFYPKAIFGITTKSGGYVRRSITWTLQNIGKYVNATFDEDNCFWTFEDGAIVIYHRITDIDLKRLLTTDHYVNSLDYFFTEFEGYEEAIINGAAGKLLAKANQKVNGN